MKTRTALMDFGQEIFGESSFQQVRDDGARPPEADDAPQVANIDQGADAMPGRLEDKPTGE